MAQQVHDVVGRTEILECSLWRRGQPKRGELVWTLRVDDITWSCEFRFQGESYGWEVQVLRDGELFAGQRFVLRQIAEAWAEAERQILEKGGV